MAILLSMGTILEAMDVFRRVGWVFYPEQFSAVMFGLASALVYLAVPAGKGRERNGPVPWYDIVAAVLAFATWLYIGIQYPNFSLFATDYPVSGIVSATVVALLLIEGLRRTCGFAITGVVLGFIILALVIHLLPSPLTGNKIALVRLLYFLNWDATAMLGLPLKIISTLVVAFIMFGQTLFLSGGSTFFTEIASVLMGRFRGGPAKISIVASSLFGTISGSTVGNVVSTGVVTIPLMKQAGYRAHVAGAIEAVSSCGGQLMPPVMGVAAFLMAEFLQVPYAAVCIAAVIPSLLYYVALFMQADLEAARYGISAVPKEKIPPAWPVIKSGWFFVVPFVVLIVTIFFLNYPIQQCALYAGAVVVLASVTVGYKGKRLHVNGVIEILRKTGITVLQIFMIGAGAGVVIGVLNITGLGFGLTISLIFLAGGSLYLLLIYSAIVSIILGMGMPTGAVYILLATLIAPALIQMGVDPMAAHLFLLYFGIKSMITPPVAVGAFAAATISGANPMRTGYSAMCFGWAGYVVPFLFVFSGTLIFHGNLIHILIDVAAAVAGIWFISAAMSGYSLRVIGAVNRIAFAFTGLALLIPMGFFRGGRLVNIVGVCMGALLLFIEFSARRRNRSEQSDPMTPLGVTS